MSVPSACMYVCHVHMQCLWKVEEDARYPGTGVTGVSYYVSVGNQTWVLYKSIKHTKLLSHSSCPYLFKKKRFYLSVCVRICARMCVHLRRP